MAQALSVSQTAPSAPAPEVAALICLLLSDVTVERQAGLLAHPGFGPLIRAALNAVEAAPVSGCTAPSSLP